MTPIGEFVYRRRVQYRDTDAAGIVHFSCFFVYAEEAEHAMWRAAGLTVEPPETTIGWPRISASFDFFNPLRFEDDIDIRIRIIERTPKTLSYQAVIVRGSEVSAAGTWTSICVRKVPGERLRAIDIPPDIANRFEVLPAVDRPRRSSRAANDDASAVGERVWRMQDNGLPG
jgi:YbgC/YbaW family acyl-CoA thioester hydrolase